MEDIFGGRGEMLNILLTRLFYGNLYKTVSFIPAAGGLVVRNTCTYMIF